MHSSSLYSTPSGKGTPHPYTCTIKFQSPVSSDKSSQVYKNMKYKVIYDYEQQQQQQQQGYLFDDIIFLTRADACPVTQAQADPANVDKDAGLNVKCISPLLTNVVYR